MLHAMRGRRSVVMVGARGGFVPLPGVVVRGRFGLHAVLSQAASERLTRGAFFEQHDELVAGRGLNLAQAVLQPGQRRRERSEQARATDA